MTRKHFKAIAEALKATRPDSYLVDGGYTGVGRQWIADVEAMARVCFKANPQFDGDRFREACGV